MLFRILISLTFIFLFSFCSKKEALYEPSKKVDAYVLYKEGLDAFQKNDYFFASAKFSEAELNFKQSELAAKASLMSSYALYGINFYDEALENLNRFLKTYPADKNIKYAHYLIAIIFYEQMGDEKKDINPLLKAQKKINFYIKNFPDTEYAIDLKFKLKLIQNQLAAKELYVARFYISTKKWIPAINRLKNIVNIYDQTIFVEEALHRLVEIHYHIGLEEEAKKYAQILGYNYNSSEWFQESYKVFNKDYKYEEKKLQKKNDENEVGFFKKMIKIINR
jgi:outer membrane protein assembly factor BamD